MVMVVCCNAARCCLSLPPVPLRHRRITLPATLNFPAVYQPRKAFVHKLKLPRGKNGEAEEIPIVENLLIDEQKLLHDLDIAIKDENYAWAAKIRDDLRTLQEDSKASVLAANTQFYNAFRNGDLAAMQSLWAEHKNVYCIHPGAGRISGYDLVMGSWEIVLGADQDFPLHIDLKDVDVHIRGDTGYVTCMEVVKTKGSSWGKQVATNVFERIDGRWFMCIHHASHIDM